MVDLTLLALALVVALGYRYVKNKQLARDVPAPSEGPPDHYDMPEMKYIPAQEASDFNASKFLLMPGSGYQRGAFGLTEVSV
jgi:hypothetical protein